MPAGNFVFGPAKSMLAAAVIDWDTPGASNLYCVFLGSGASSALSATSGVVDYVSMSQIATNLSAFQFGGGGYTVGGLSLAGRGISTLGGDAYLTASNLSIAAMTAGQNASNSDVSDLIIYYAHSLSGGASSTAGIPVARLKLAQPYTGTGASFTITWSSNGIIKLA